MTVSPIASPELGATSPALPAITPQTKSKYEYLCLDLTRAYCREAVSDQSTCLSVIAKVALLAFPLIAILAALEAVFDLVIAAPITFIANCIAGPQEITPEILPAEPNSCGIPNPEEHARIEESQVPTVSETSDEEPQTPVGQGQETPTATTEQSDEESQVQVGQGQATQTVNATTAQPNRETQASGVQGQAAPTVTEAAEQLTKEPHTPVGQGQATQTTTTEQSDEEPQTLVDQGQTAPTVNTTNVITPSDTSGPKVLKAAQTKNPTPRQALKKGKNKGKSQNLLQAEQRAAKAEAEKKEAQIKLRAKIAASAEARKSRQ